MASTDRKSARLKDRIQGIRKELTQVEDDVRLLRKAVQQQDPEALSRFKERQVQRAPPPPPPLSGAANGPGRAGGPRLASTELRAGARAMAGTAMPGPVAEDLFTRAAAPGAEAAPPSGPAGAGTPAASRPLARPNMDPRLASYLTAGSFHSVHPLRQERRIQRSRAILVVLLAALLLFWVIHLIRQML